MVIYSEGFRENVLKVKKRSVSTYNFNCIKYYSRFNMLNVYFTNFLAYMVIYI